MKYYKPELRKPDDLPIPKEEIETSPLARVLGSGKTIKTSLDIDVAIDRFADGIYSGYKSGLRELYNNEARACRQSRDEHNANPEIHITLDPTERSFTIEGKDSLGITVDVFENSLTIMGITSNNNANEIGQMGMGFASYTTLAQSIKVDTWARDSDECYSFMAENGKKFDPLPNPKMKQYGTKISGTYYEMNPRTKETIYIDEVLTHLNKLARYSTIPTYIHLTEDTSDYDSGTTMCKGYDSPKEYLMEEFRDQCTDKENRELTYQKEIEITNDDYEFYGIIGIEKTNWDNAYACSMEDMDMPLTLLGTPVIADELDWENRQNANKIKTCFTGYVLNIKNERKYKPTADRDRMVAGAMQTVYQEIVDDLKAKFDWVILDDIEDFNSREDQTPYTNAMWHMISEIVDDETTESIVDTLNSHYTTAPSKHWTSLSEMLLKRKDMKNEKKIDFKVVALKSLRSDMMDRLDTAFGQHRIYFRLPTKDDDDERANRIHVLQQLDVVMGEAYARDNNVKRQRGTVKGQQIDVRCRVYGGYTAEGYFKPTYWKPHKSFYMSEINKAVNDKTKATRNLILVDKDRFNNAKDIHAERTVFQIARWKKGFDEKIKTDIQMLEECGRIEMEVNTDKMLVKDIPYGKTIIYCDFKDKGKELDGFTLEELGLNPKDMLFIAPTNKNIKDIKRFKDMLSWYFSEKSYGHTHTWEFETEGGGYVKTALAKELGIARMSGDDLEKTAGLLRIRREIIDTYPHLYYIIKEAICWCGNNNQDEMRDQMMKHLEEIKK